VADVAAEWLDAAMYVLMLLQTARRGECFAAAGALMLADSGPAWLAV